MIEVYIVHNDPEVEERVRAADIKADPFIHFIDEGTKKGKSAAYKLKSAWGARLTPFAAVFNGDEIVKAFYTEADKDVIGTLINYLKNENTNN